MATGHHKVAQNPLSENLKVAFRVRAIPTMCSIYTLWQKTMEVITSSAHIPLTPVMHQRLQSLQCVSAAQLAQSKKTVKTVVDSLLHMHVSGLRSLSEQCRQARFYLHHAISCLSNVASNSLVEVFFWLR